MLQLQTGMVLDAIGTTTSRRPRVPCSSFASATRRRALGRRFNLVQELRRACMGGSEGGVLAFVREGKGRGRVRAERR